jgi:hypothetical protein
VILAQRERAAKLALAAAIAFVVGASSLVIPRQQRVEPQTIAAITEKAAQLGSLLDGALERARDRAEGFAGTPVLEAGILTDAATVADIVNTEYRLKTRPEETLELFQLRGDQSTTLVRVPSKAAPIALPKGANARVEDRGGLTVVVKVPVAPYDSTPELAGELALAARVDLSALALTRDATAALLMAGGQQVGLVKGTMASSPVVATVGVKPSWNLGTLALHATPVTTKYVAGWVTATRYGVFGISLVLASVALVTLLRFRRKRAEAATNARRA